MANGISELIDQLYTMVSDAWGLPLGAEKCVLERDKVLDLLDEIKSLLPAELTEAKRLVAAKAEFIAAAKEEASKIKRDAEEQGRRLVESQNIVKAAKQRADELLATAETKANELRRAANAYADDTLRRTEEAITLALTEVKKSRSNFRSAVGARD
jgi:cell division septum initiation protein DivIVA